MDLETQVRFAPVLSDGAQASIGADTTSTIDAFAPLSIRCPPTLPQKESLGHTKCTLRILCALGLLYSEKDEIRLAPLHSISSFCHQKARCKSSSIQLRSAFMRGQLSWSMYRYYSASIIIICGPAFGSKLPRPHHPPRRYGLGHKFANCNSCLHSLTRYFRHYELQGKFTPSTKYLQTQHPPSDRHSRCR